MRAQERIEFVHSLIFSSSPPSEADVHRLVVFVGDEQGCASELTTAEQQAYSAAVKAVRLLLALFQYKAGEKKASEERIIEGLRQLQASAPTDRSQNISDGQNGAWQLPPWSYYHGNFTRLEVLMAQNKLAAKALNHCKNVLRISGASMKEATTLCSDIQSNAAKEHKALLEQTAAERKNAQKMLADDDVVPQLLAEAGDEVANALESIVGVHEMKRWLRNVGEAAIDSLKSVEQIVLP